MLDGPMGRRRREPAHPPAPSLAAQQQAQLLRHERGAWDELHACLGADPRVSMAQELRERLESEVRERERARALARGTRGERTKGGGGGGGRGGGTEVWGGGGGGGRGGGGGAGGARGGGGAAEGGGGGERGGGGGGGLGPEEQDRCASWGREAILFKEGAGEREKSLLETSECAGDLTRRGHGALSG